MSAAYGWIITKDYLEGDDETNAVGILGPRDISDEVEAALKAGAGVTFDLFDDDGEHYYQGRLYSAAGAQDAGDFAECPLDDFGAGYAGCTAVTYPQFPYWNVG